MATGTRKSSSETWDKTFAKRLTILFDGETLKETAAKLGVSSALVGFWRNGQNRPDYEMLRKISEMYHASIDWILGRTELRSCNEEVQSICSYTGLTEQAVAVLHYMNAATDLNKFNEANMFLIKTVLDAMHDFSVEAGYMDPDGNVLKEQGVPSVFMDMADYLSLNGKSGETVQLSNSFHRLADKDAVSRSYLLSCIGRDLDSLRHRLTASDCKIRKPIDQ